MIGRNQQMHAYKQTVASLLEGVAMMESGQYSVTFYFWRRLDGRKHPADATNMQKATEDALQEVLFKNDRDIRDIRSVVVEQSAETKPLVLLRIGMWHGYDPMEIPLEYLQEALRDEEETVSQENVWPPRA